MRDRITQYTGISVTIRTRARELRQEMTPAEESLWARLRNRRLEGLKFRRQSPIGHYIIDFECSGSGLVVEIDGGAHKDRAVEDNERTEWLGAQGLRVVRFTNEEVLNNIDGALDVIASACGRRGISVVSVPSPPTPLPKKERGEEQVIAKRD